MADRSTPLMPVGKPPTPINVGLVGKLEALLEKARQGHVTDLVCLYFEAGHPSFEEDIALGRRLEFIALAELWQNAKAREFAEELDEED